jgi:hypothetical protein
MDFEMCSSEDSLIDRLYIEHSESARLYHKLTGLQYVNKPVLILAGISKFLDQQRKSLVSSTRNLRKRVSVQLRQGKNAEQE